MLKNAEALKRSAMRLQAGKELTSGDKRNIQRLSEKSLVNTKELVKSLMIMEKEQSNER